MTIELTMTRTFHDLGNMLGSVILNLEVTADPKCDPAMLREASADALAEARKIDTALRNLRAAIASKHEGA